MERYKCKAHRWNLNVFLYLDLFFSCDFAAANETVRKERCAQRTYIAYKLSKLPCSNLGQLKVLADTYKDLLERPYEAGEAVVVRVCCLIFAIACCLVNMFFVVVPKTKMGI